MPYESIDVLQQALTKEVFHYAKDAKKAAGRALGTLVEIVNFYLLKTWNYENHIAIERRIPEYANPDITHNVEFTLHPTENIANIQLNETELPFTEKKIKRQIKAGSWCDESFKTTTLLSNPKILRNACTIYENDKEIVIAYLGNKKGVSWSISVERLHPHPFAMFECKRVGVEEGVKKGPQTIEKAKQGAYVARTVSSLQKLRMANGDLHGVLSLPNGELRHESYQKFLEIIVNSNKPDLLRHFILTVGIVSNHGNWFTSENHNKELKVLAQSYDWLLFLTDIGLAKFVDDLLLNPVNKYLDVKKSFMNSYTGEKGKNNFTKVKMSLSADKAIQKYFRENLQEIESWFHIISPCDMTIQKLKEELDVLVSKKWWEILQ